MSNEVQTVLAVQTITKTDLTSLEIAEMTGKDHSKVLLNIRTMLLELEMTEADFGFSYKDASGKSNTMFKLDADLNLTLLTGYYPKARLALIKRWRSLESGLVATTNSFMIQDPIERAKAWIAEQEAFKATKAEIGNRREATAMATASVARKKANRLEIELDKSKEYFTVKRVSMLAGGQAFNWRLLKSAGKDLNVAPEDVFDANYGTVKSYHYSVWVEAFAIDPRNI